MAGALAWAALAGWVAVPKAQAAPGIYVCVDHNGRRLTSDRPIPECLDREQRLLNKDGSQRAVLGPRVTAREKAEREEALRQQALAEQAHKDAVRRDRNLMKRYPNEAAHNKARQAALDDFRKAMGSSQKRMTDLQAERRALNNDAEFYKGKPMPFKLRTAIEGNEASQQAQLDIIDNHKAEMVRITALYDVELARLRKLWGGAQPGTLPEEGAPPQNAGAAAGVPPMASVSQSASASSAR